MILTDEQVMIRDMARQFAQREIAPHAADWDRAQEIPRAVLTRMGELEIGRASCRERV